MPGSLGPEALTTDLIARNVSSTCNSSGSVIWASAKNIKPLVDANRHAEAVEFAYHQSLTQFPPIYYRHPGSKSLSRSGQTVLFGCPLELHTAGELKKIPPVLDYLLDSLDYWQNGVNSVPPVGQQHRGCTSNSLYSKLEIFWPLANKLEQAWTGVEKTDRAIISKLAPQNKHRMFLILVCLLRRIMQKLSDLQGYFRALPKPVWTDKDIDIAREVVSNPSSLIWNIWNEDPTKLAVLRAIVSCQVRLGRVGHFGLDMSNSLVQKPVCPIYSNSLKVEEVDC